MKELAEQSPKKTKILIVENSNVRNLNLHNSLKNYSEFDIIGTVDNINATIYSLKIYMPHVIIINLTHVGLKGIDILYKIKELSQNSKIVILSNGNDKNEIQASITAGTNAYCLSDISMNSLSLVIKTVAKGACWFDPIATPTLLNSLPSIKNNNASPLISPLTMREMEVLRLMANGKNNTIIAKELIVSVHTAKAHVCNILHKMQVTDRVQAAVKAFKLGLVQ